MPRAKNRVASRRRRKKYMKQAKGYRGGRRTRYKLAKNAVQKALGFQYRDRRTKKRRFRQLWITRINAAARQHGVSYSRLMGGIRKNDIELNRKVLAELAVHEPDAFKAVVEKATS